MYRTIASRFVAQRGTVRLVATKGFQRTMAHTSFPQDLPVPQDDGACDHLKGASIPSITLSSTSDDTSGVDLSARPGLSLIFLYPRSGAPGETVPDSWNAIPGARGCTPQACAFRDLADEFATLGVTEIFGLSTQSTEYQLEHKKRNHLPFDILSDEKLELTKALNLPTFEWEGKQVTKRITMAVQRGTIVKVFYPVFPPNRTDDVVEWLKEYKS